MNLTEEMSDAAFEAEFRKSGRDRIFNDYIALHRLHIAVAGLLREVTRPILSAMESCLSKLTRSKLHP